MHSIAIFGGTFDPIHSGHLQTSLALQTHFKFDSFRLLPCKIPTIKPPALASNEERINMIELAIRNYKEISIDLREIQRDSPSYMVDTLKSFRLEFPNASITLIIGYDAFLSLPQWHQWEEITTLSNIIVINRNEFSSAPIPEILRRFLKKHQSNNKDDILTHQTGTVFLFDAGNYDISSSAIRDDIKVNNGAKNKLPKEVYEYIRAEGLYR